MDMYPDDYRGGAVYLFVPLYAAIPAVVIAYYIYRIERYDDRLVAYAYNVPGGDMSFGNDALWTLDVCF